MRDRLVHTHERYADSELISKLLANFTMPPVWSGYTEPLISVNDGGTDLALHPAFERTIQKLSTFYMTDGFLVRFPELTSYVNTSSTAVLLPEPTAPSIYDFFPQATPDKSQFNDSPSNTLLLGQETSGMDSMGMMDTNAFNFELVA